MELYKGGDLFNMLKKVKNFNENDIVFILVCLLYGL